MEVFYPHYFKDFSCIAAACPDSCCKEWEVDIDPEAYARYRELPGELGDRLRRVLRPGEDGWASMTITDRRCPMWRLDGLCDIQGTFGHDALCKTCREFPRLTHDYGTFQEWGLELSCPEAARLILGCSHTQWVQETLPGGEEPDYDVQIMDTLRQSRKWVLELLETNTLSLGEALSVMLLYGYDIHQSLEFPEAETVVPDVDAYLETVRNIPKSGNMAALFRVYEGFEILTDDWKALLAAGPVDRDWLPEHRALAIYLVQRYWLQAVSDWDLLCRVKFIITACLTVRHLDAPVYRAAQLWSKEIENDGDNVEALLTAAYHSPALTDVNLINNALA